MASVALLEKRPKTTSATASAVVQVRPSDSLGRQLVRASVVALERPWGFPGSHSATASVEVSVSVQELPSGCREAQSAMAWDSVLERPLDSLA